MRRTQVYLDDQLWDILYTRALKEKTTVSELVRQAIREQYLGNREQRMLVMQRFIGIRKATKAAPYSTEEVRSLRRGSRVDRLDQ